MGGVSRYTLAVYILLSAKQGVYFCQSVAIEMGGVHCIAILFKNMGVRVRFGSPDFLRFQGFGVFRVQQGGRTLGFLVFVGF